MGQKKLRKIRVIPVDKKKLIPRYKLIASKFFDSSPKGKISWIPWFRTAPANKLRLVCKRIQKEDWRIG